MIRNVICGNCLDILKMLPDNYVDLVFTSPPYADKHKKYYDSIDAHCYVDWFLPIANEIKRVLKNNGSFF